MLSRLADLVGLSSGSDMAGALAVVVFLAAAALMLVLAAGAAPILLVRVFGAPIAGLVHLSHGSMTVASALWSRLAARRDLFGSARWASRRDLEASGMTGKGGLFLGEAEGRTITHQGEGHILTIANTGGGKSTGLVVPALLTYPGTVIVTDPKGELTAMTALARRRFGRVVVLNPWRRDMIADTGLDMGDDGFNPLAFLKPGEDLRTEAALVARLLVPESGRGGDEFFIRQGRALITGFLVWMIENLPPSRCTLSELYTILRGGPDLENLLLDLAQGEQPFLKAFGGQFYGTLTNAPRQWEGVLGTAQDACEIYAPGDALSGHVGKNGLDLTALKRENVSVYLLIPSRRILTHKPWLNLVIALMAETVGMPGPAKQVTLLLDEFPALGYLPNIRDAMRQYRSAGLRAWLFAQTGAVLRDVYGAEGANDLFALCATRQFFAVSEPDIAALVERSLGEATETRTFAGGAPEMVGRPLMRASEVLTMQAGTQIILRQGEKPIKARLVPYYTRPQLGRLAAPNPYRNAAGARAAWEARRR